MSLTNGSWRAAGLSSATDMTASPTTGRRTVKATASTMTARTSAKTRNFRNPTSPFPPRPPFPPPRERGIGSEYSGIDSVA
jgi:hypothetical protein